jgi:selenocysteine lyase/cysteine desulfurase
VIADADTAGLIGRPEADWLPKAAWGDRGAPAVPGFLAAYPGYRETGVLDALRADEYGYLDDGGHTYLDYAGAGLPARAQLRGFADRMQGSCYGNPHSQNPTSAASTALIERARSAVLEFFNAPQDEYSVIFTANASAACRLVGEAYPFGPRTPLVLTWDNHNSVNGIREFARARGAVTRYVPFCSPELRVDEGAVREVLGRRRPGAVSGAWRVARAGVVPWAGRGLRARRQRQVARAWVGDGRPPVTVLAGQPQRARRGLLAFPAQSNFSGVQHPLSWVDLAHEHGYDVLLDAAAFVPSNRLDLSRVRADFVPVSWYKMFGYPTGVGCLIARREALARLWRPWFSGGTISTASVQGQWHVLAGDEARFEDGTPSFLHIPDVEFGLSWISGIGIETIHQRVSCLTGWMLDRLAAMRHSSGQPMARIYGPANLRARGGTVTFNLLDPSGRLVDERAVTRDTAAAGISIRTGCFCNPGAAEKMFDLTRADVTRGLRRDTRTMDEYIGLLGAPTGGAIRASLGLASTVEDAERFLSFLEATYRDRVPDVSDLAPRAGC